MTKRVQHVVIAGGGTAGWMTAAALSALVPGPVRVTLVESDAIPTVGVGEATIPAILSFHQLLKIDEREFMKATNATFKLGIEFQNWKHAQQRYFHSFGSTGKDCWAATFHNFWLKAQQQGKAADYEAYCLEAQAATANRFAHFENNGLNYAYHLDAGLYAKFLRARAEAAGVSRIEGTIEGVEQDSQTGDISRVMLANGRQIDADFFVDCSGFRALLIGQTLKSDFDDWSHWLPSNRAIAVQSEKLAHLPPYTRSSAHSAGWQWQIPLQNRTGNGIVFSDEFLSEADAEETLLSSLNSQPLTDPRVIRFQTGFRPQQWVKNCVAVGLSGGFIEPLESTSIHMIQRAIIRLLQLFPYNGVEQADIDEFNRQAWQETEYIRDFIILHYHVNQRASDSFWQHCRTMDIPDSLAHRIELFKTSGRIFRESVDLFAENSWVQVMMGQGLTPAHYHVLADVMSEPELQGFLSGIQRNVTQAVAPLPTQSQYLSHYLASQR